MTTTSAALIPVAPVFTNTEGRALGPESDLDAYGPRIRQVIIGAAGPPA